MRYADWQSWQRKSSELLRDEGGATVIIFAIVLIPVLILIGLAVDGLRAFSAAETAHSAADAAALAAARAMSEGNLSNDEITDIANRYFQANAAGTGKLPYARFGPIDVKTDRDSGSVTVSVDTAVPTTFGQLARVDELVMTRSATAVIGLSDIELGLMLDVTGSMNRNDKLGALKRATADLIDTLIPEGGNADKVRIGLAPYSEQVNVGPYADVVSDSRNRTGCVVERRGPSLNTDTAPSRIDAFHVMTRDEEQRYRRGICPPAEIEPLTSDKERLRSIVQDYRAGGWTAGHLGIQWAWNLVSPRWSGIWPGGSTPRAYDTPNLIKAVVLMTDGEFNTAYTGRPGLGAMMAESYDHTEELCRNIKREGVIVFAVAFDLREPRARRALEDCASDDGFFHRAENEEELRRAYRNIAVKLTELRLAR